MAATGLRADDLPCVIISRYGRNVLRLERMSFGLQRVQLDQPVGQRVKIAVRVFRRTAVCNAVCRGIAREGFGGRLGRLVSSRGRLQ